MRSNTITALALPILALALSGCGKSYEPEPSLPVRAEVSKAPPFATPPAELVKRPEIIDFLPPESEPERLNEPKKSSSSATSSPPDRRSSLTR